MTAPAPGLPQDVAITLAVYTEAVRENAVIPFTVGHLDSRESALLAALRAAILAAMRAATAGSGAASAVAAGSAAHVAPGGEPVAWAVVNPKMSGRILFCDERAARNAARMDGDAVEPLYIRPSPMDAGAVERARVAAWEAAHDSLRDDVLHNADGFDNDIVNHFLGMIDDADQRPYDHIAAHVAPPVSASFEEALKGVDVEHAHHTDEMITTHIILGLDDVRAAHRAEVDRLAARLAEEIKWGHARCTPEVCQSSGVDCPAAIRARGVAKPRTDGEAATRSGEGAKS